MPTYRRHALRDFCSQPSTPVGSPGLAKSEADGPAEQVQVQRLDDTDRVGERDGRLRHVEGDELARWRRCSASVGEHVAGDANDVVKISSTISGSYDAPEASQLVAAMNPVKTSGDAFDSHLSSAADALITSADKVRTIKKTLEGIRGEANAMLATIDGSGKMEPLTPTPSSLQPLTRTVAIGLVRGLFQFVHQRGSKP